MSVILAGVGDEGLQAEVEPRAARSVHLGWKAPESDAFYNEMVVDESTTGSYFMACGWDTGYFGIQELGSPEKKVAIFSVWDPTRGDNPDSVSTEDRVEVLHAKPEARIKRFGGEGTGGQCMIDFPWAIGATNRFLVQSTVEGQKTAYAGFLFDPGQGVWMHLVTFRVRTRGRHLRGYYSFLEDFRRDGKSVKERRRARFSNGMVKTLQSGWVVITQATFTASGAEWEAKENIDGGASVEAFFLATGGDVRASRPLRTTVSRAPSGVVLPVPETASLIETDWTRAPECEAFAREATRIAEAWYPRLSALLRGPDSPLPYPKVQLVFDRFSGIAETAGNRIRVAAEWVTKTAPRDYGMVVHELTHVVQDYQGKGIGWVTEGIADYVRYGLFEPQTGRLGVDPSRCSYRDGYEAAGALLAWVESGKGPGVVRRLNLASREDRLDESALKEILGGDPNDLWKAFAASVAGKK